MLRHVHTPAAKAVALQIEPRALTKPRNSPVSRGREADRARRRDALLGAAERPRGIGFVGPGKKALVKPKRVVDPDDVLTSAEAKRFAPESQTDTPREDAAMGRHETRLGCQPAMPLVEHYAKNAKPSQALRLRPPKSVTNEAGG